MNSFQILNKEGNPIPINTLDAEVCELVSNPIDKKHYCILAKREDFEEGIRGTFDFLNKGNWFDTIGWLIAEGNSFQDILDYYADVIKDFIGKEDEEGNIITLEKIYPYHTKVINSWISKGYIAKQITD